MQNATISDPNQNQCLVTATRFQTNPDKHEHNFDFATGIVENRHLGWCIAYDLQDGPLYSTPGAADVATFFRSAAKPFQTYPLVEAGYDTLLTQEELAIACASHTGSQKHLALAGSILQKAGLSEADLQCGPHQPTDKAMRSQLRQSQCPPGKLHNNCSGKHAGMLLYCHKTGLPTKTYLDPRHPLQESILKNLKQESGLEKIPLAVDGCGAPVFYLPLSVMAKLYAQLGSNEAYAPLRNAMIRHPEIIGGEGCVDTVIMQVSQGKILAKVGADGVLCASRCDTGQGVAIKIADGSTAIRNLAFVGILNSLGWLTPEQSRDQRLQIFLDRRRINTRGEAVGLYEIHHLPKALPKVSESPGCQ